MKESDTNYAKTKKANFLKAYETNFALLQKTLKETGINQKEFYSWIDTDSEFEEEIDAIRGRVINLVEDKMFAKILKEGNEKLIEFFLKAKGDYKDQKDINLNAKMDFSLNFDLSDDDENEEK